MTPRRGNIGPLATMLAALCLLVWGAGTSQAAVPKSFWGVVPQAPLGAEDFERMGAGKVGTLRFELFWAGIDPSAAPLDYDWSGPDALVRQAAENGIQPLPFIFSTPQWVAALDGRGCSGSDCLAFAPKGAAALEAWEGFLREAVGRYGPDGEFWTLNPLVPRKPIRVWQIWNEQNSPTFFKPKPKPKAYAKLLARAEAAITSVDPGAEIVLGGMFGTPFGGRKPGISAWDFLAKLYAVKGAKRTFDGVAPHPYAAQLSKVVAQIDLMRDEMKAARDRSADLWITELGWASGGPKNPLNRGLEGQASRLREAFKYFRKKRRKLSIRNVDWYSWRDNSASSAGLCEWCPESGLFTESLEAKPSWNAFTSFTGGS